MFTIRNSPSSNFLLSEENLSADTELRKYMTSDGFVPVEILRELTPLKPFDVDVIKSACEEMEGIELNKEMDGFDRVRRSEYGDRWVLPVLERHPLAKEVRWPAMQAFSMNDGLATASSAPDF